MTLPNQCSNVNKTTQAGGGEIRRERVQPVAKCCCGLQEISYNGGQFSERS